MNGSIRNLYQCLAFHPAIARMVNAQLPISILIGTDSAHAAIGNNIAQRCPRWLNARVDHLSLERTDEDDLRAAIVACDIYVFLYSSSTRETISPAGPPFLAGIKETMIVYWRKSVLFKDYGAHLYEAFAEPIEQISQRNKMLITAAANADFISYTDAHGGRLVGMLHPGQSWTSVDGHGNEDVVPGEIATHMSNLKGHVQFSGTFLSTVPFARKYGVVKDFMTLFVEDGRLVGFDCSDEAFRRDFNTYLDAHPGNRIVEEFGIGTNTGIRCLYGLNAGFEERHPGLHLGLGGGKTGSHHLDLLFSGGQICFDRRVIYDDGFQI